MVEIKRKKNKGVKDRTRNFYVKTIHKKLKGIYIYLSFTNKSSLKSMKECDEFIIAFCKYELNFIGSLYECANLVQDNFDLFKKAAEYNKDINN